VTTRVPHNLPPQPTPFIGRESELADLEELIAKPSVRLITIIGAGGMGKTRLALAAAERFLDEKGPGQLFPNGVAFVDLTPLSAVDHVVPALAEALKFRFNSGAGETRTPREQILDYLRAKRTLLIMDNFEHLLAPPAEGIPTPPLTFPPREGKEERVASPAVGGMEGGEALVADLLAAAPHVKILTTSRERLSLQAEQVYPIQGLEFPDRETPEDVTGYTAVRLFLQSARRARPDFELATRDNAAPLTRIARLVGGMPLALELAAGWVDVIFWPKSQPRSSAAWTFWRPICAMCRTATGAYALSLITPGSGWTKWSGTPWLVFPCFAGVVRATPPGRSRVHRCACWPPYPTSRLSSTARQTVAIIFTS
jgi:hypothetical protein